MGLIIKYKPILTAESKEIAAEYLGQREYIKQVLWPAEFEVEKEDIVIVPQAAYHLDIFLKPALQGAMFMQDNASSMRLLADLLLHGFDLNLGKKDIEILHNFIDETIQVKKDLEPIYKRVQAALTEAGFKIIKTPASFFGYDDGSVANVNFMNAVSGWSEQNNRHYYICLGAKIGDNIGALLMHDFTLFMEEHVADIKIHFIGFTAHEEEKNFAVAMKFFNRQCSQAGAHCLSYELEQATRN